MGPHERVVAERLAGVREAGNLVACGGLNCFNPPGQRAAHNHAASGNASSLATIASMRSKSASISSAGMW